MTYAFQQIVELCWINDTISILIDLTKNKAHFLFLVYWFNCGHQLAKFIKINVSISVGVNLSNSFIDRFISERNLQL